VSFHKKPVLFCVIFPVAAFYVYFIQILMSSSTPERYSRARDETGQTKGGKESGGLVAAAADRPANNYRESKKGRRKRRRWLAKKKKKGILAQSSILLHPQLTI
jgi:hypothetical protein